MQPDYCASASKLFTVAHIRDPGAKCKDETSGQPATCGKTVCGLDMTLADLWQLINLEPGDRVCTRCQSPESAESEQGALL